MKVAISNKTAHEWSAVCSQFGVEYEPVKQVEHYGIDGETGYVISHYHVTDEHMANWIKIIRPRWIVNG